MRKEYIGDGIYAEDTKDSRIRLEVKRTMAYTDTHVIYLDKHETVPMLIRYINQTFKTNYQNLKPTD